MKSDTEKNFGLFELDTKKSPSKRGGLDSFYQKQTGWCLTSTYIGTQHCQVLRFLFLIDGKDCCASPLQHNTKENLFFDRMFEKKLFFL